MTQINPTNPCKDPILESLTEALRRDEPAQPLVKVDEPDQPDFGLTWDASSSVLRSGIDPTDPRGRALITQAFSKADKGIRNVAGTRIAVVNFVAHVVTLLDKQTFEVVQKIRLVMMLEDSTTVSTVSEPCVKTFAFISHYAGKCPWSPPIILEVKEVATEGGKSYCTLKEIYTEPATQPPPAKNGKAK